jgi:hypothetical protein
MLMHNNSYQYLEELPKITESINNTPSRPLGGMLPSEVNEDTQEEVGYRAYLERTKRDKPRIKQATASAKKPKSPYKFKVNDKVRITHLRHTFQREYEQKWTGEIFIIQRRYVSQGITVYKLKDFLGEPISGTFYAQELQKVNKSERNLWKVDKILKERKINGVPHVLVSWDQWPSKFNSYVKKSDIQEI